MLMVHLYELFCDDCATDVCRDLEKVGHGEAMTDAVETLTPVLCGKCRKLMFPGERKIA